jgi:hypothetical protein
VANSYPGGIHPARTITKLRLSDGSLLGTVRVGRNPQLLASDGNHVWVSNWYPNSTVIQFRAINGARQHVFEEGTDPLGMLFDGTSLWIAYYGSGTVCKITDVAP